MMQIFFVYQLLNIVSRHLFVISLWLNQTNVLRQKLVVFIYFGQKQLENITFKKKQRSLFVPSLVILSKP